LSISLNKSVLQSHFFDDSPFLVQFSPFKTTIRFEAGLIFFFNFSGSAMDFCPARLPGSFGSEL